MNDRENICLIYTLLIRSGKSAGGSRPLTLGVPLSCPKLGNTYTSSVQCSENRLEYIYPVQVVQIQVTVTRKNIQPNYISAFAVILVLSLKFACKTK